MVSQQLVSPANAGVHGGLGTAQAAQVIALTTRPGLAITAPNDPFVRGHDLGAAVAAELGATQVVLEGQGHWWMLGDPAGGARALEQFWAAL